MMLKVHVLGCLRIIHCYMLLLLLLLAPGCFSSCVIMCSNGSVLVCLCSWVQRYCLAEICVGFIYCLFHVTGQSVFVM